KPLSEFLSDLPKTFATPEIRVECAEEIKFKLVDEVKNFFKDKYQIIDVDGVRVIFDDGWGLVRASNTQPALVLRFEAKSEKRLNDIKEMVEKVVEDKKKELEG
ncbi:MAG: phosphomannomutase, partial [Deltaproteobacteria bacterium]|nr:phosphomannomutase [Deltaproteobacteria bacterium]